MTTDAEGAASFSTRFPTVTPRSHYISATATGPGGNTSEFAAALWLNRPPVAVAGPDRTADEGTMLLFDGRDSTDVDGEALTYRWDFGDGTSATGATPFHAFPDDGVYTVTLTVDDGDGGVVTDRKVIDVTNVAPMLTNDGPKAARQYSDFLVPVAITATDPGRNDVLSTAIISGPSGFTLAWDPTTRTGTLGGRANVTPGSYTIRVRVTDDGGGWGETSVTLNVAKEDARATYAGVLYASTPTVNANQALVNLVSTIQDITAIDPAGDPNAGDIRNAEVRFEVYDADNPSVLLQTISAGNPVLVSVSDPTTGRVVTSGTFDIGNGDTKQFLIRTIVNGYYTGREEVMLTVSRPLNNSISGGGYIVNQASGGTYAGSPGEKTNFGFNVKFNKNATNLQGQVNVFIVKDGRTYQIKSNMLTSLGVAPRPTPTSPGVAQFTGKANLRDITDPRNPIDLGGNKTLQMSLTDKGEPGFADMIGITLWDGAKLLYSSRWTGTTTVEQVLGGGNLVVRDATQALSAAGGAAPSGAATEGTIDQAALEPIVRQAMGLWTAEGVDPGRLDGLEFQIRDLPDAYLGWTYGSTITLDRDGAGYGWFVDASPADDVEFSPAHAGDEAVALIHEAAEGIDLLSVIAHELGHLLGLGHQHGPDHAHELMAETIGRGVRRLPGPDDLADPHADEIPFDPTFEAIVTVPAGVPSGATREDALPVALDAVAAETIAGASRLDRQALDALAADRPEAVATGQRTPPIAEAPAARVILKRRLPVAVRRSLRALLAASPPLLRPARWAVDLRRFGI